MRRSMACTAVLAYVIVGHPPPVSAQVDQQLAQEYFKQAQALCERDGGRLWGVSLCGPMVIADAATGTIATSQPAPAGDRPRAIGYVNAPVQWGGITWSAYNWQMIPKDNAGERGRLFMHELFHCIQPGLGLTDWRLRPQREHASRFARGPLLDAARVAGAGAGTWRLWCGAHDRDCGCAGVSCGAVPAFPRRRGKGAPRRDQRRDRDVHAICDRVGGCTGRDPERDRRTGGGGVGHIFRPDVRVRDLELVMGCCSTRCLQAGTEKSPPRAILASCCPRRLA